MPFPAALLWGAAAVAAGVGVKKGLDAKGNFDSAKSIGESAERKYKKAEKECEAARKKTQDSLEILGKIKMTVFTHQIKHLVEVCQQLKQTSSKLAGFNESVLLAGLKDAETMVAHSLEIEKGLGSAAATSALAAFGAYGSVGLLASASTGTAISGLTGVAATNATLAWLGGGSLAAGGFGMAGGMVALGGIALAPALAVGGLWMASKSEKALTQAYKYSADVDKAVEQLNLLKIELKAIRSAAAEQAGVILEMAKRFDQVKVSSVEDTEAFKRMFEVGKGLKELLMIPVMQEDGSANPHLKQQCTGLLEIGN